jgi:hypothetical protein
MDIKVSANRYVNRYELLIDGKMRGIKRDNLVSFFENLIKIAPMLTSAEYSYILATVQHETAGTFLPLREFGRGIGKKYGRVVVAPNNKGNRYYGRGYVQITWAENYLKLGSTLKELNYIKDSNDLINNPDLALDPEIALVIVVEGMCGGLFTGKKLSDYTLPEDFYHARQIVNRLDKASLIASYANNYYRVFKNLMLV